MRRLDRNGYTVRFKRVEQSLSDLLGQAFLQLQPSGEGID
jgi:hypothetical protein